VLRRRLELARRRVNINDLWIAAIAKANGLRVVTQDDDFDVIADAGGPAVVKV
jgi:predicted nucleic acid-binding protein